MAVAHGAGEGRDRGGAGGSGRRRRRTGSSSTAVAARGLRRRAGVGGGSSGVGRLVGPRVLGLASGWATGGDKGILFFLRISFAESRREKLSAKKKTSYFLQIPFAESQPVRLSAKILCREPDVQALGKELLTFFIFLF